MRQTGERVVSVIPEDKSVKDKTEHTESFNKMSEMVLLVAGVVLFLVLVYMVLPILSPYVMLGSVLFLLYPSRHYLFVRRMMWLAGILFAIWLINNLMGVLVPFIIALLLAYLLNPVVNYLQRKKFSRLVATIIVVVILLGTAVSLFIFFIPNVFTQFQSLTMNLSSFIKTTVAYIQEGSFFRTLARYGIPVENIRTMISEQWPSRIEIVIASILQGAFGFLTNVTSIITQVFGALVIPFLTFYLIKDYPLIIDRLKSFIPGPRKESISFYFEKVDDLLGQYVRGVMLVALIQGVGVAIGLFIIGVEYALVLGIMSGVLNIIPYVGFYSSMAIAAIVALFSGDPVTVKFISVIALYVGLNAIENIFIAPKIVGDKVGLHPVVLILSLVIFGNILGFVGLLVAVPITAILIMTLRLREEERQSSSLLAAEKQ